MSMLRSLLPGLALVALTMLAPSLFAAEPEQRPHTAGPGVHVLAPMAMPGLDRSRIVRVYLPPDYATSKRRYPVLYMHDGQNLFDDATSYVGEWGVDEAMDALARSDGLELIVVGIDHGGDRRLNELSPWANPRFGPAEGEQYAKFVVEIVKPWIDAHYRTLPDRKHTGVMGSSMGGLMSHYLVHHYPQVFGRAGVFSPSYWFAGEAVFADTRAHPLPSDTRIWLVAGGAEGDEDMLPQLARMTDLLQAQRHWRTRIHSTVVPDAKHNEMAWRADFPAAVRWLFGP